MALSPFAFLVVVLAAYRATTALVTDSITAGLRARWIVWCVNGGRARSSLADLVECPRCAGFHLSWITYAVAVLLLGTWHGTSILLHVLSAWAVAGAQVLLSTLDHALTEAR